jgi:TolA-binding protein
VRFSSITIRAGMIVALGLFSACSDQSANMNQLNQNEFALRGMIASDRQQIDALRAELRRTQDEFAELKHGAATGTSAAAPADVSDRLTKLESEVNALQVALPVPAPSPSPAAGAETPGTPAPATVSTTTTPPPSTTSAGLPPPPSAGAPSAANASAEPAPTWPQDLDKEIAAAQSSKEPGAKIYRKALDAMKAGSYPTAIVDFAKVQHGFPKSPLSEPAQYFTANAFYESGKNEQAILQFNDLTMRFPNSRFLCESLLREGQSFVRLNDRIDARLTLRKLAGNANCSAEAGAANNLLKNLGSD